MFPEYNNINYSCITTIQVHVCLQCLLGQFDSFGWTETFIPLFLGFLHSEPKMKDRNKNKSKDMQFSPCGNIPIMKKYV